MLELFTLDKFDIYAVIDELAREGATSVPILSEDFRLALHKEAESYPYTPEAEVVGTGNKIVRQQLAGFSDFPPDGQYSRLKDAFQTLLDNHLTALKSYPFATKLNLNAMAMNKYESGSIGITPHRDRLKYINLVCIFNIAGRGRFYLCDDRTGSNAREIDSSTGSVILMKAPGFMNSQRPFHYVTDIQSTRYTFGLRQQAAISKL